MLKSILIPIDFSANALSACKYGLAIAHKLNGTVHIAHAYVAFHSGFQTEDANERDRLQAAADAQKEMDEFLQQLGNTPGREHIRSSIFQGHLLPAIQQWVNETGSDLIIMGIKGASSGLGQKLIGSQSYNVARSSTLPVIVVPLEIEHFKLDQIAFFTNYHDGDLYALKTLESLFGASESAYRLIHIQESSDKPSDASFKKLKDWASLLAKNAATEHLTWEVAYGKESAASVNEIAARNNTDLLVMTVEDEGFFARWFDKNLTKEVIRQSKTPVLLVRSYETEHSQIPITPK